ncbi:hypothetical protein [Actinoplanes nipponensis]|uniref:Uncharacterized protein n=1 Tax=Actinoplanes nipponensis TaxID=135950 RepID=A0A919MQU9_9ACTN|nr:hypothetical protein [Actinoplanes nipponensis]GIE53542.1 hypothetical protein Ani05nite_70760 [Actinoplanes nipponensis]
MTYPEYSRDLEAPEADAAEQAALADPASDDSEPSAGSSSIEAPEWDAWEQRQAVPLDDDER